MKGASAAYCNASATFRGTLLTLRSPSSSADGVGSFAIRRRLRFDFGRDRQEWFDLGMQSRW